MDNAQKAIMIGVGLFITIIVIAAVMLITGLGQDLLNSGTNQLGGISESLRIQVTDQYDGKTLTASQVKTACSDLFNRNDPSISIYIGADTDSDKMNNYEAAKTKLSGVSISKKYVGNVTYDSSSGTVKIVFTG